MTPFNALLRVTLRENFSMKRFLGTGASKSKLTKGLLILAVLYAFGAFLGSFGYMFYILGEALNTMGFIEMLLMFLFFYGTGFAVMFTMLRANGSLFRFKDYEMLVPLPFSAKQIMTVKLLVLMINLYLTILLFTAPILFAYFSFANVGIPSVLNLVIAFFFIPLIPTALCSILAMLIARVTSRFRKNNLITIILMFVFFLGIMVLSFSFSFSGATGENPFLGQVDFIESLGAIYLPMMWFADAVHNGNMISLLWLTLVSGIPFALFILFLSKMMMKTNALSMVTKTSIVQKKVIYEQSGIYETLIAKEFRKFLNTPNYALNAGFGPVILLIAGIASLFFKDTVLGYLQMMVEVGMATELLVLVFVLFCVSMVYTSAISLSLEGKSFWVVRSLPIQPLTVIKSKLLFNIALGLPVALLATVLFTISFEIPFLSMIVMMIAVTSVSVLTSTMGSIINLYFPKFDFVNEIEVVKQSVAALISVFASFGIIVMNGFLYYGLSTIFSLEIALFLVSVVNGLIGYLFYIWMVRVTAKRFLQFAV